MSGFAALQDAFQRAILDGDDKVLGELTDGANESRAALLGVYRYAYGSRLVEALRASYEILAHYMGDEMFDEMAAAYVASAPSRVRNMRYFGGSLPGFLATTAPYADYPVVSDLAGLEQALADAFDAPEGDVLGGEQLAGMPPDAWQHLVVAPHPSARRLTLSTNAAAIWSAVREDADVPAPETMEAPAELLVWRHDATPMWRQLPAEEAMMWNEAAAGLPFGQLCVMLATFDDPDGAAGRAAGYLAGWVGAGLLGSAHVEATASRAS